jgi:ATP-binding cassette subfamily B protein
MQHIERASAFRIYLRALREVRPFWPHLLAILALALIETPLGLVAPLPMKVILDSVLGGAPPPAWFDPARLGLEPGTLLALAIGLTLVLAALALGHRLGAWFFREWTAERMVHAFRVKLYGRMLESAALGRDAAASQDLAYRISSDAPAIQWTAIYGFIPVAQSLTALAATFAVTWTLSHKLAAVALATALPMLALVHFNQRALKVRWHAVKEHESEAGAVLQETIGGLRIVATFGQERRETARFRDATRRSYRAKFGVIRYQGAIDGLLGLVTAAGGAAILALGTLDVLARSMSVGDLVLAMTYVAQLHAPLTALGTHFSGQQQAVASAERAFALLDAPPAVAERLGARPLAAAEGRIELRGVGFGYPGRGTVLDGVDVAIPAGARIGIVGATGSGKSSLVSLLMRFLDPAEGRILLDGIDIRELRLADLRRQYAVVPQEPLLFSASIAENIAYGRPDAGMDEIVAAARAAQAHDFIMRLPEGYATPVGERGAKLSGGERQRIAIARAFLKNAPILILDEPTSALDGATEALVLEGLERLMAGRTTLMIAHRLETLSGLDMILRVEDGRVLCVSAAGGLAVAA